MTLYEKSQLLLLEAERLLQKSDIESARRCLASAAELQWRFVRSLPDERIGTRSVYGLSAASLYYRAQDLEKSEEIAHLLLSEARLEERSASELRALLTRIWDERELARQNLEIGEDGISVTFRKGQVLSGLAPTEAIDTPLASVLSLFQRIAAWRTRRPLERRPDELLQERYHAYASPPVLGSYQIGLYLVRAKQPPLDLPELPSLPSPDEVIADFMDIVNKTVSTDDAGLQGLVPQNDYRVHFARLIKNMLPDGHQVGEIELRRIRAPRETAVTLNQFHRHAVTRMIRAMRPRPRGRRATTEVQPEQHIGRLRAVDLDQNKLRLERSKPDGPLAFAKAEDILDDVVGPLLNKLVVITGSLVVHRGPEGKRFVATDIDLAAAPQAGEP